MSALTELKARITGPDGHLLDRNTIAAELERAIEKDSLSVTERGYLPVPSDALMFRINKQRDHIKELRAHLDSEGKLAGSYLFKCGVYEIMVRRLWEWDGMYLSDGMARQEFKAILKECEETRP